MIMKKLLLATIALLLITSTSLPATNYVVSGAGTAATNGTYEESGTTPYGKPYYENPENEYTIVWMPANGGDPDALYIIAFEDFLYYVPSSADTESNTYSIK
jgi:hypothetical protein